MATDNTIHIEVLALLDPKSGGVINEKQFTKQLTKDLRNTIRETEKTLKALTVNPSIAVHPTYAGMKDKDKFLEALKKDKKALLKQANKVFEKLDVTGRMNVALDIDKAKKDFVRQLAKLESALVTTAKTKSKVISRAVTEALNINPKALIALEALNPSQGGRVSSAASNARTRTLATGSPSADPKLGKELFDSAGRNISRVNDAHLESVKAYLRQEQEALTKNLDKTLAAGEKVTKAQEAKLDKVSKALNTTSKRLHNYTVATERALRNRERAFSRAHKIASSGASSVPAGDRKAVLETLKDQLTIEKRRHKGVVSDRVLSEIKKSSKGLDQLSGSIGELEKQMKSSQSQKDLRRKRDVVAEKLGAEKGLSKSGKYTESQARSLNQIERLLGDSSLIKKGKLVISDTPEAIKKRSALLNAFEDAKTSGLLRDKAQVNLLKDLNKSVTKDLQRRASDSEKRGASTYARNKGSLAEVNQSELRDVKEFLDRAISNTEQQQKKFFDRNGRYSKKLNSTLERLHTDSATTSKAIRELPRGTQSLNRTIKAARTALAKYEAAPDSFSRDERAKLLRDLQLSKAGLNRQYKGEQLSPEGSKKLSKAIGSLEGGIKRLQPTLTTSYSDKDRGRVADQISKALTGRKGQFAIPSTLTRAQENMVNDLRSHLNSKPFAETLSKRFHDLTESDINHLEKTRESVRKATSAGLLDRKNARLINDRIDLATRPKSVAYAGHLRDSDTLKEDFLSGRYSGANALSGIARAQENSRELNSQATKLLKSQRTLSDRIDGYVSRLKKGDYLGDDHKRQLERQVRSLEAERNAQSNLHDKVIRQREQSSQIANRLVNASKPQDSGLPPHNPDKGQISLLLKQFARLYIGFAVLGTAVGGVIALMRELTVLDTNMKSVQAAALGTSEQMVNIKASIQSVGLTTKFTVGEISEAARILVQADVPLKDIPSTLRATANLAAATDSDIGISSDLITSFSKVYKDYTPDEVASLLTKTFNLSKLAAEDLKVILGIATQTANAMGLTGEQFLSAMVVLRNQGLKASTVGTGLRQALNEVFAPDTKTVKVLSERYAAIGEDLGGAEIRGKFASFRDSASPLIEVLSELKRLGFGGSAKKQFSRFIDLRAENALNALVGQMDELSKREFELPFNDSALRASDIQLQSLEATLKNLGAAITVVSGSVFDPMLSGLKDMAKGLTDVLVDLDQLNSKVVASGQSGLGSVGITTILGGVTGGLLSRGAGAAGRVASVAAGAAAGGYAGTSSFGNVDVASINASMATLITLLSLGTGGLSTGLTNMRQFGGDFKRIFKKQAKVTTRFASDIPMLEAEVKAASKSSSVVVTGMKRGLSSIKLLASGFMRLIPVIGWLAFLGGILYDLTTLPDQTQVLRNLKKTLLVSKEKIDKAGREAAQFTDDEGATASAVLKRHADSVMEYFGTIKSLGLSAEDTADVTALVKEVLADGLDAATQSYKELADVLIASGGGLVNKKNVGDFIRTLTNLQRAITNSSKASIEQMKSYIAGIDDKLLNGNTLSDVESSIKDAWEDMLYTNAEMYTAVMGSLKNLSQGAATRLLADMKNKFDTAASDAEAAVRKRELQNIRDNYDSQEKLLHTRIREAGFKVQIAHTEEARDSALQAFNKEVEKGTRLIGEFATTLPSAESGTVQREQLEALRVFATGVLEKRTKFTTRAEKGGAGYLTVRRKENVPDDTAFGDLSVAPTARDKALLTLNRNIEHQIENSKLLEQIPVDAAKNKVKLLAETVMRLKDNADEVTLASDGEAQISIEQLIREASPSNNERNAELVSLVVNDPDILLSQLVPKNGPGEKDTEALARNRQVDKLIKTLQSVGTSLIPFRAEIEKRDSDSPEQIKAQADLIKKGLSVYTKGVNVESSKKVDTLISLMGKSLDVQIEGVSKSLELATKVGDSGAYKSFNAEELTTLEGQLADLNSKKAQLPFVREGLIQGLKRRVPRARRKARDPEKAKRDKEKAKRETAERNARKKLEAEALKVLKKRLANLKYDGNSASELEKVTKERANLLRDINSREFARDTVAAEATDTLLNEKLRSKVVLARKTDADERLTEALKKNATAYEAAQLKLEAKQTDDFIKKVDRKQDLPPTFLSVEDAKGDQAEELLQASLGTKELIARYRATDVKKADIRAKLLAKIQDYSGKMTDKLQQYIGTTSFGRQLALMNSLIAMTETRPIDDALLRLPDTISSAIIAPIFNSKDSDESLGERIVESLKTGFRSEAQTIATEYFKQGIAGVMSNIIDDSLPQDEAMAVQKDMVKALHGDIKASERLAVVMQAVAEGQDVGLALKRYDSSHANDHQEKRYGLLGLFDRMRTVFDRKDRRSTSGTTYTTDGGMIQNMPNDQSANKYSMGDLLFGKDSASSRVIGGKGYDDSDSMGEDIQAKAQGVLSDLFTGFSDLFNTDGDLFGNIGQFFTDVFGKDSTIGSVISDLFTGLLGKDSPLSGLLSGLFNSSGGGGKGGGFLSTIFSFMGKSKGFAKGVSGYGRVTGSSGYDSIDAIGLTKQGGAEPLRVMQNESILTPMASQVLGYDTVDALNAGKFTASPLRVSGGASSGSGSPNLNVSVAPPITQVIIGPEDIEKALNTRAGRQAVSKIVDEVKA